MDIAQICLDLMENDWNFYYAALGKNRYPAFAEQYRQVIIDCLYQHLLPKGHITKTKRLETEFSTNGVLGILRYWILHKEEYQKEEILQSLRTIVVELGKIICATG